MWRYEGKMYPQIGLNAVAGKPPAEYGMEPVRYDHMIPGCYDPAERIKDMDIDGVHAALCLPVVPGVRRRSVPTRRRQGARAGVHAGLERLPDRRMVCDGTRPADPVGDSSDLGSSSWPPAEVERLAPSAPGRCPFPTAPSPLGYPSFHHPTHWEVLWDALEAADMPVCLHFGSGGYVPGLLVRRPAQ